MLSWMIRPPSSHDVVDSEVQVRGGATVRGRM